MLGEKPMLEKLKSTAKKVVRYDPFGSIDSALQDQQGRIDELEARLQTLTSIQEWYNIATRHLDIGVAVISRTRQVLWANAFLTELVGNTERGFCHALLCGLSKNCPSCKMDEILSGALSKATFTLTLQCRNSRTVDADLTALPIFDAGGSIVGVIEIMLVKTPAQKLADAIAACGGVIPADSPAVLPQNTDDADAYAAGPAGDNELLQGPVNVNTLIEEYLASPKCLKLSAEHPYVCFTNNLESELAEISVSPGRLVKCLSTLLATAAERVSGIGEVHIRTRNVAATDPAITAHELASGPYIAISVSESGAAGSVRDAGIQQPETWPGRPELESVRNAMREHQGRLVVETLADGSARYTMFLPAQYVPEASVSDTAAPQQQPCVGKTVLVVDDMTDQRALATTILKQLGFSVASVRSGAEAVDYLTRSSVDLVLLNMIMFGTDGLQTFRQIVEIRPDQKVLLVSGYSINTRLRQERELQGHTFIKKPYRIEVLGPAVARELGIESGKQ